MTTLAIVLGALFLVCVIDLVVFKAIGVLSGWNELAKRYPAKDPPAGETFRWQSAKFGWLSYNNALWITAGQEGLDIRPFWLLRVGHPLLLIPWHQMHNLTSVKRAFRSFVRIDVGEPVVVTITLQEQVMRAKPSR